MVFDEGLVKWLAKIFLAGTIVIHTLNPFKCEFPKSILFSLNNLSADMDRNTILNLWNINPTDF